MTPWHFEYRIQLPGQPIRWLWAQSVPEKLEDGSIIWTGYNVDITENKKKEEILKESEERFRKLIENTPTAIYVNDINGNFLDGNKVAEKMMGYSREELIGKNMLSIGIISEESIPQVIRELTENLQGQKTGPNEYVLKKKDGTFITAEISSFPIEKQGKVEIVGVARDITEMKRIQDDLRFSEEKYRTYVENSPVAFFVVGSDGKYEQVNDTACKLLGYSRKELLKMSIVNLLFEEDVSLGLKQFASLKETGKSLFEVALKRKDGVPVYVILNATRLPEGKMMAFCENITERVKAEDALRCSEEKFRLLFENAPDIICTADLNGKLVDANTQAKKVLGYGKEELIGKSILDLFTKDDAAKIMKDLSDSLQGQKTGAINYDMKAKGGMIVPVEISTFPVRIDDKVEIIGIGRDISERKKAEQAIN